MDCFGRPVLVRGPLLKVHRIAQQLDIFRLLSFFYSSVGFYLNQVRSESRPLFLFVVQTRSLTVASAAIASQLYDR